MPRPQRFLYKIHILPTAKKSINNWNGKCEAFEKTTRNVWVVTWCFLLFRESTKWEIVSKAICLYDNWFSTFGQNSLQSRNARHGKQIKMKWKTPSNTNNWSSDEETSSAFATHRSSWFNKARSFSCACIFVNVCVSWAQTIVKQWQRWRVSMHGESMMTMTAFQQRRHLMANLKWTPRHVSIETNELNNKNSTPKWENIFSLCSCSLFRHWLFCVLLLCCVVNSQWKPLNSFSVWPKWQANRWIPIVRFHFNLVSRTYFSFHWKFRAWNFIFRCNFQLIHS